LYQQGGIDVDVHVPHRLNYMEDYDEDLQKAIFSSIDSSQQKDSEDMFQTILQTKDRGNCADVLPKLGSLLEQMSRQCFDVIARSGLGGSAFTHGAVVALWFELQQSLEVGFRSIYSFGEQKDLLACLIRRPEEMMHILVGVAKGLLSGKLFFNLAKEIIVDGARKDVVKSSSYAECDTHTFELEIPDISNIIMKFKSLNLSLGDVVIDLLSLYRSYSTPAIDYIPRLAIRSALIDVIQASLSYLLLKSTFSPPSRADQHIDTYYHAEFDIGEAKNSSKGPALLKQCFGAIVSAVDDELKDIQKYIPDAVTASKSPPAEIEDGQYKFPPVIENILSNSMTAKLLACIGGIITSSTLRIENLIIFFPFALDLIKSFRGFMGAFSTPNVISIQSRLQNWLVDQMKWIILLLSSVVGLCTRVGVEGHVGDDKYNISKAFQSCVSSILDQEYIMRTTLHPVWSRVGSQVRGWRWFGFASSHLTRPSPNTMSMLLVSGQFFQLSDKDDPPRRTALYQYTEEWKKIVAAVLYYSRLDSGSATKDPIFSVPICDHYFRSICSLCALTENYLTSSHGIGIGEILGVPYSVLGLLLVIEEWMNSALRYTRHTQSKPLARILPSDSAPRVEALLLMESWENSFGSEILHKFQSWMVELRLHVTLILLIFSGTGKELCESTIPVEDRSQTEQAHLAEVWLLGSVLLVKDLENFIQEAKLDNVDRLIAFIDKCKRSNHILYFSKFITASERYKTFLQLPLRVYQSTTSLLLTVNHSSTGFDKNGLK
jgi:hypothetical protein